MVNSQPEIVNVVISTWTDRLNIERLARTLPKLIYEPDAFAGLIYHRQVPKATVIMFSTGRIVTTGSRSVKQGKESLNVTLSELCLIGKKDMMLKNSKIENIVIKGDFKHQINLKKLARKIKNSKYNPDLFPALICIDKPNPSCLVFRTGKIISAGSKNEVQAHKSIKDMIAQIKNQNVIKNEDETIRKVLK